MLYSAILFVKFLGIMLYAGGLAACFICSNADERKRAVHAVASPGLMITWIAGYLLAVNREISLTEPWIIASFLLSLVSQMAMVKSVVREQRTLRAFLWTALPYVAVLALMVFRPSWSALGVG